MKKTQEELNRELLEAVLANDIVAFGQALTNGAQVNHRFFLEGQTALHLAAYDGRDEMVKWLIAYGADVEAQDKKGYTPLMLAMQEQHTRCSAWLREQVVKLEAKPESPLRFKTEAEFVKEFGEDWRHTWDKRWNKYGEMDYLFGLPCKPEWVGSLQTMHPSKCPHGDPRWNVEAWMVTTDPLPQEQPVRVTVITWLDTLPPQLKEAALALLPEEHKDTPAGTLAEALAYCKGQKPPLHERYPVGSKMRIEVQVKKWDVASDVDVEIYLEEGEQPAWCQSRYLKIIED